jgi:carbamoyltransferase
VHEWFDMAGMDESSFMMYAVDVLPERIGQVTSITHVDNTCRIQTVTKEQNKHYYNLIDAFKKLTGVPILFNTSFNLAGDPLVETFEDAINTLRRSKLEYLYVPSKALLLKKKNA